MQEAGFIYIAYGEKFILESVRSAQTLRTHVKDADITLFTDRANKYNNGLNIFNQVIERDMKNSYIDKPICMKQTPYRKTLFLDSDTYICEDISGLFGLLDYFDIAAVIEPPQTFSYLFDNGLSDYKSKEWDSSLKYLSEYNTGVILYRTNKDTETFWDEWTKIYNERFNLDPHDQMSFALALAKVRVQFVTLPFEFNFRYVGPSLLFNNVKILHGRFTRSYTKLISSINEKGDSGKLRCWSPAHRRCFCDEGSGLRKVALRTRKFLAPYFQPVRDRFKLHGDLIMPKKERFKR